MLFMLDFDVPARATGANGTPEKWFKLLRMQQAETKPRVLVADDEQVIADTLVLILNHNGYEARQVYTGHDAVTLAADFKPDFLIIDVLLVGLAGIEAAAEIKKFLPDLRVVLFTGNSATTHIYDRVRALGHEFDILVKPVHPDRMLAWLRGEGRDS